MEHAQTLLPKLTTSVASLSRLPAVLAIGRNFSNWLEVLRFGWKNTDFEETMKVKLRDAYCTELSMTRQNLKSFIRLCVFSDMIGYRPVEDIPVLNRIGEEVTRGLTERFSKMELDQSSSGGGFDTKSMLLFALIRRFRPSLITETGVAQGVTSYVMLEAIALNGYGRLISVDFPNRNTAGYTYYDGTRDLVYTPSDLQPGWLVPSALRQYWDLRLGKSAEVLPSITEQIDMFFHDSEHSHDNMTFEYEWAWSHLKGGGILASDDIDWNASFTAFQARHQDSKPILKWANIGILTKIG